MNNPVIGIKLSDGTFYPVLKRDGAEKKRLILTVANRDQNKAVIELFRGEGEAMEIPEKIGALVVDDVGGADHDIELVLDRQEDGNLKASAKVSGGHQSETIEIRADQGPYIETDDSNDMEMLQDDALAADGIDDFSLDGLESPGFDVSEDAETIEDTGLMVGDTSSDEELESFDLGSLDDGEDVSSADDSEEVKPGDDLGDFDLGSLDDGEDTASMEGASQDSTDSLDDFSFDSLDDAGSASAEDDSLEMDELSLDSEETDFGDSLESKPAAAPVADFSLDEISLDESFDDAGSGETTGASDDFDLGDDFSLDDASLGDVAPGGLSTDDDSELPDDLAWSPPGGQDFDEGSSDSFEGEEETWQPEEAPEKPQKPEKKPKEKPAAKVKKESEAKGQPDRVSLILGMVVFIPLALLLIVLVVLNMIRPASSPPLTQQLAPCSLVMGVQQWEQPQIEQQEGTTVPFV